MKIAQRFSAGLPIKNEIKARETGDRRYGTGSDRVHCELEKSRRTRLLPQVVLCRNISAVRFADSLIKNMNCDPSDKSLGYFRPSASRTMNRGDAHELRARERAASTCCAGSFSLSVIQQLAVRLTRVFSSRRPTFLSFDRSNQNHLPACHLRLRRPLLSGRLMSRV